MTEATTDAAGPPDVSTAPAEVARWFAPAVALVAIGGLVLRWWYLVTSRVDRQPTFNQGDAFWYSAVANNLAAGKWFENPFYGDPTADHPPLTILVLWPASKFFDGSTYAQRFTMVLLGTATIVLVGLIGRRLAGPTAGVVAAVAVALSPSLWINDVVIMSESLTALLVAVVIGLGVLLAERPTHRMAVATGAACGLAALARAEIALFLPLMAWPILALRGDAERRVRLVRMGLAAGATALVIAPWSLWNLTRFQEPVAISTNDGLTLLGANCDVTYGSLKGGWTLSRCTSPVMETLDQRKPADGPTAFDEPCADSSQKRPPCWDPSTKSKIMRDEALSYVRQHLDEVPGVVLARHGRVWGWYRMDQAASAGFFEGRKPTVTRYGFYTTWAMAPFVLVGLVSLRRRGVSLLPFVAPWAVVVVVTTLFYGLVRFRVPYDLAACLLVGVAVAALVDDGPRGLFSRSGTDANGP